MTAPQRPAANSDARKRAEERTVPPFPCCEHCEPEADGRCWAWRIGHGCSCLECKDRT